MRGGEGSWGKIYGTRESGGGWRRLPRAVTSAFAESYLLVNAH